MNKYRNKKNFLYLSTETRRSLIPVERYRPFFEFLYLFSRNKIFPLCCIRYDNYFPAWYWTILCKNRLSIYFHYKNIPVKEYRTKIGFLLINRKKLHMKRNIIVYRGYRGQNWVPETNLGTKKGLYWSQERGIASFLWSNIDNFLVPIWITGTRFWPLYPV